MKPKHTKTSSKVIKKPWEKKNHICGGRRKGQRSLRRRTNWCQLIDYLCEFLRASRTALIQFHMAAAAAAAKQGQQPRTHTQTTRTICKMRSEVSRRRHANEPVQGAQVSKAHLVVSDRRPRLNRRPTEQSSQAEEPLAAAAAAAAVPRAASRSQVTWSEVNSTMSPDWIGLNIVVVARSSFNPGLATNRLFIYYRLINIDLLNWRPIWQNSLFQMSCPFLWPIFSTTRLGHMGPAGHILLIITMP